MRSPARRSASSMHDRSPPCSSSTAAVRSASCTSTTACAPELPERKEGCAEAGVAVRKTAPLADALRSSANGRRRRIAKAIRWGLAGSAAGVVAFALLWPELGPEEGRLKLGGGHVDETIVSNKDTAIDSTFRGIDKYGRPFQVTSPHTESADPERGTLDLAMPVGDMTMSDGRRVHLTADRGLYDP